MYQVANVLIYPSQQLSAMCLTVVLWHMRSQRLKLGSAPGAQRHWQVAEPRVRCGDGILTVVSHLVSERPRGPPLPAQKGLNLSRYMKVWKVGWEVGERGIWLWSLLIYDSLLLDCQMNASPRSLLWIPKYPPLSLPILCNILAVPKLVRTFNQLLKGEN